MIPARHTVAKIQNVSRPLVSENAHCYKSLKNMVNIMTAFCTKKILTPWSGKFINVVLANVRKPFLSLQRYVDTPIILSVSQSIYSFTPRHKIPIFKEEIWFQRSKWRLIGEGGIYRCWPPPSFTVVIVILQLAMFLYHCIHFDSKDCKHYKWYKKQSQLT